MKFDDLDKKCTFMKLLMIFAYLGNYMVARIDGRKFTRLTKEKYNFKAPFDERFRDYMVETVHHLMNCGFRVVYGYTKSDEISLLFHHMDEPVFGRKMRKFQSILAGEASACFSLALGQLASFDCRIAILPSQELVVDYFRWHNEDAHRNALNAYCHWTMRKEGTSIQEATSQFEGKSIAAKNEYLFQNSINFNDVPSWQKRGVGLYWETYMKEGINPKTKETTSTTRQRIKIDYDLPMKDMYSDWIKSFLGNA